MELFESLGIFAFALSGLIEAARKKLDFVGMVIVSSLAAFGGGTLRDVLLDRRPFFWVQNSAWVWILVVLCVLAMFFLRRRYLSFTERAMQWPDAIGLGVFSAGGTAVALSMHAEPVIAVIMGTITAVFGGVLRDVVVNQIPRAFNDHQPYTVLSFAGGWIVVLGYQLGWGELPSVLVCSAVIVVLRVLAMIFGWRLPTWRA
ncbi:MAG: trimeric intracellular cation channel family protein [Actinomycetes bacterium]